MKAIMVGVLLFTLMPQDSPSAQASPDDQPGTATVYIYKTWHAATLWRAAFAVYLDDKMIVRLDRGIYCVVHVTPGTHQLRTKDKKSGGLEINFEAGKIYYVRMQTDTGAQVTHPRLSIPSPEESNFDLKQMQPVASGDIKDKNVVSIPERFGKKARNK
jgi:hypothetical protein